MILIDFKALHAVGACWASQTQSLSLVAMIQSTSKDVKFDAAVFRSSQGAPR